MTVQGATPPPGPDDRASLTLRHKWEFADRGPNAVRGAATQVDRPGWLDAPATPEQRPPRPLSPSSLGEETPIPGDLAPEAALQRGNAMHKLLETLPLHPEAERAALAETLCPDAPELAQMACNLIASPHLQHVFAPDALAEVDIAPAFGARQRGARDRFQDPFPASGPPGGSSARDCGTDGRLCPRAGRDLSRSPDPQLCLVDRNRGFDGITARSCDRGLQNHDISLTQRGPKPRLRADFVFPSREEMAWPPLL